MRRFDEAMMSCSHMFVEEDEEDDADEVAEEESREDFKVA